MGMQSCCGTYLVQPDVLEGLLLSTQATGHLLALPHPARVRPASDATRCPVVLGVTVCGVLAGKVPALHDTSKALALGCACR